MKRVFAAAAALCIVLAGCTQDKMPHAKHVIFLGFDGQGAYGIQRAHTPTFNYMIENGAVCLDVRSIRPTCSQPNWTSMVTGVPSEIHGVIDNDWTYDSQTFEPAGPKNGRNLFPTMFDDIRAARPDAKIHGYIEWGGETKMFDMSAFDKGAWSGDGTGKSYSADEIMDLAFADYFAEEPDLLYVSIDAPDGAADVESFEGKHYFDCIQHMDERVGEFLKELEARGMMKDAVIIISADHGGIRYGHGGDSLDEMKTPAILYGKGVTKGKVMEHTCMMYDHAATVCGLLGVEMPAECRGKFMWEAFEPKTDLCYVPMPLVTPYRGVVGPDDKISINCDIDGAEIFYTLDGSTPTKESPKYEAPFTIDKSTTIKSVAYRKGCYSQVAVNALGSTVDAGEPAVFFKLWRRYYGESVPDFSMFGKPDASGYITNFTVDELPVEEEEDDYAVLFTSKLVIPEAGKYTFELASDDGANLYIDDRLVVANGGSHPFTARIGNAELSAGEHAVRVEYFEDCEAQQLVLSYAKAGESIRAIFPSELKR